MKEGWIELNTGCEGGSVMEALQAQGVYMAGNCGSNGTCGKCRVRFLSDAPLPSAADEKLLSADAIARGERLACKAQAAAGMRVEVIAPDESAMKVEASFSLPNGHMPGKSGSGADPEADSDRRSIKAPGGRNMEAPRGKTTEAPDGRIMSAPDGQIMAASGGQTTEIPDGRIMAASNGRIMAASNGRIMAAVDIGTTTIVMSAVETGTGRILQTVTGVNHQRAWGADVISRMEASNQGRGTDLQKSILSDLDQLREKLGLPADVHMVISGNTTMEHLLQGLPCRTLGLAPYTPVDISLHEYENMTILPGISTFVGADIVSGIVACGMDQSEEICLLVDLGTNGEMAIGNRDRILSASTAAGPAFEGGNISCGIPGIPGAVCSVEIEDRTALVQTIGGRPAAGICGTGVLEVVYELLKEELIDETGLLDDDYFDDGFPVAEDLVFTGKDVREVQLAKAAVRAGMEVLIESYGTDYAHIGKLYLAGGFGQKINLKKAVGIGLLPEELLDCMVPVGNSSLAGAVMAAGNPAILERMAETARKAEETALAESPLFSDLYMDHMFFPEEE